MPVFLFRKALAPEKIKIEVDHSNTEAEKAIEKALAKLGLVLVKKKIYRRVPEAPPETEMLFRKE